MYKLSNTRFSGLPAVPQPSNKGFNTSGYVNTYSIRDLKAAARAQ